jgi:carbon-monoxide dehydrogenase medium subunit
MKPPAFDYVVAKSTDDAVNRLAEFGDDASVIAGGQSLVPMLALRLARPSVLVDINRVAELGGAKLDGTTLRIGAMTRQNTIMRDPLVMKHAPALAAATRLVGHHQTRNRGTIGGSLALGEPASEYPATSVALSAQIELRSKEGTRTVPAREFYEGAYSTVRKAGEMIVSVAFPGWPEGTVMTVDEIARRPGDFALTGIIVALAIDTGGKITRAGIAWFGMAQTPCAAVQAEKALVGQAASNLDITAIANLAVADTEPWDDIHATGAYRRIVGARLAARVMKKALAMKGIA